MINAWISVHNRFRISVMDMKSVFDSSDGYPGVWHLNDNWTDATNRNHDAKVGTSDDVEAEIISSGDGCLLCMDDTEKASGVSDSDHLVGETSLTPVCSGENLRKTGW